MSFVNLLMVLQLGGSQPVEQIQRGSQEDVEIYIESQPV
jgi:hypothetical protein